MKTSAKAPAQAPAKAGVPARQQPLRAAPATPVPQTDWSREADPGALSQEPPRFGFGFDKIAIQPHPPPPVGDHSAVANPAPGSYAGDVGWPLDSGVRREMEHHIGHDFSSVRLHTGAEGDRVTRAAGAVGLTVGNHIWLGEGPSGDSLRDRLVLGHELAHVVQQRRGGDVPPLDASAAHEADATRASVGVALGRRVSVGAATGVGAARVTPEELERMMQEAAAQWRAEPEHKRGPGATGEGAFRANLANRGTSSVDFNRFAGRTPNTPHLDASSREGVAQIKVKGTPGNETKPSTIKSYVKDLRNLVSPEYDTRGAGGEVRARNAAELMLENRETLEKEGAWPDALKDLDSKLPKEEQVAKVLDHFKTEAKLTIPSDQVDAVRAMAIEKAKAHPERYGLDPSGDLQAQAEQLAARVESVGLTLKSLSSISADLHAGKTQLSALDEPVTAAAPPPAKAPPAEAPPAESPEAEAPATRVRIAEPPEAEAPATRVRADHEAAEREAAAEHEAAEAERPAPKRLESAHAEPPTHPSTSPSPGERPPLHLADPPRGPRSPDEPHVDLLGRPLPERASPIMYPPGGKKPALSRHVDRLPFKTQPQPGSPPEPRAPTPSREGGAPALEHPSPAPQPPASPSVPAAMAAIPASTEQKPPAATEQKPPAATEQKPPAATEQPSPAPSHEGPEESRPPAESKARKPGSLGFTPIVTGNGAGGTFTVSTSTPDYSTGDVTVAGHATGSGTLLVEGGSAADATGAAQELTQDAVQRSCDLQGLITSVEFEPVLTGGVDLLQRNVNADVAVGVLLKWRGGNESRAMIHIAQAALTGKGIHGSVMSLELRHTIPFLAFQSRWHGLKISGGVNLDLSLTVQPNWLSIGKRLLPRLAGSVASEGGAMASRALEGLATAEVAVAGLGAYITIKSMVASFEDFDDMRAAARSAERAVQGYAGGFSAAMGGKDVAGNKRYHAQGAADGAQALAARVAELVKASENPLTEEEARAKIRAFCAAQPDRVYDAIYGSVNTVIKESFVEQWKSKLTSMQKLFTDTDFDESLLRTMMGLQLKQGHQETAAPSPPPQADTGPRASSDPVGDSLRDVKQKQTEAGRGIQGQLSSARNTAYGAGNRLFAWIQTDHKPMAIDAHNRGMELLRSADANAARLPKQPSTDDFLTWGYAAMTDYSSAKSAFDEGLARYPPGRPPKS